jgi:ABC-type dipeptide/oligopeptide/nickel transport system permease subunit
VLPLLVLALLLACAVAPGWIAPYAPTDMDDIAILAPPDGAHWAGTDHFGRDVLSLMIYGARQSLLMGFWAVLVGGVLGGGTGLAAGYLGGRVDLLLMRLLDIWMSVPDILLAIILAAAMGAGLTNTILAVGLVLVPRFARIMRAQVLAVRGLPFVEASRAMGTAPWRIVLRHVLPHTVSQMLVMATLGLGSAILIGASLSFIGPRRHRRPARLGIPAEPGPQLPDRRLVVRHPAGLGHHRPGHLGKPAGRRAARPAGPSPRGTMRNGVRTAFPARARMPAANRCSGHALIFVWSRDSHLGLNRPATITLRKAASK